MVKNAIAVIDFGGQYAHLIATKIRRCRVLAEIRQPEDGADELRRYKGIVISGSPSLASRGPDPEYNRKIFDLDVPILGICFGHQEMAKHYGGKVVHGGREWGPSVLHISEEHPLFHGLNRNEQVWMSHHDSVDEPGADFEEIGYSVVAGDRNKHRNAVVVSDRLRRYGVQFHPEVDDTPNGHIMLGNFVLRICGCSPAWTMDHYMQTAIEDIRARVGDRSVFLLVSGGVDSTVAAKLISEAIGSERLHLLHIDNGLMRMDESKKVMEMLEDLGMGTNLHFVDAGRSFIEALRGVAEPEKKRIIIGSTFVEVLKREAGRLDLRHSIFGQGTIYPDTIETGGTRRADTIKTHHNRVPMIEKMISEGKVIEPLSELYKIEVRELGEKLGIPEDSIRRHPFPGPGFGIRLLCSTGVPDEKELHRISSAVRDIACEYGLHALPLPIRSVGVKGDARSYEHPVLLSGEVPWEQVIEAANVILSSVNGVNRCVRNLSDTRPRQVRRLEADVCMERLELLRKVDAEVMGALRRRGLYHGIWQCPTVLAPLEIDHEGRELVILRPVHSGRGMTASPANLPGDVLDELVGTISRFSGISGLCIDVTSKPPGTIEWE